MGLSSESMASRKNTMTHSKDYILSECLPYSGAGGLWELHRKFSSTLKLDFDEWLAERDRCRKDLFHLGKDVLKKDWLEKPHREYCSYFVQKNFDGVYHADYTLSDVHDGFMRQVRTDKSGAPTREMLLLAPRGSYKSTVDGVDCVQWLLNAPDCRILILAGEDDLSEAFLFEIKQYFTHPEESKYTRFQRLFPEYIISGKEGNSSQPLRTPARHHTGQKEPSLWVNSIPSNLSGWHCDVKKNDDVVTDRNSNSPEAREKINKKIILANKLVDQWGVKDTIGTPYEDGDYYHERLRAMKAGATLLYGNYPGWVPKPGFEYVPLKSLKIDMVDLLFPEKLTFTSMWLDLLENENVFKRQMLCIVGADTDTTTFTEEQLRAHLLMPTYEIPFASECYITWDWATSTAKTADFSAGAVCYSDKNKGIILADLNYGRWKPADLAYQIVRTAMTYKPKITLIEKMAGSELLQMEIARVSRQCEFPMNIWWREPDKNLGAKAIRIKSLQTLLNQDKLWFISAPWNDDLFHQLQRFTGTRENKGRKDDLPDALSMVQFFVPNVLEPEKPVVKTPAQEEAELKAAHDAIRDGFYQRMFKKSKPPQQTIEVPAVPVGLPDIFGGNGISV